MSAEVLERPASVMQVAGGGGVGAAMRGRREALGLSVRALAERAGVDRSRVTAVEDGQTVRASTLGAIEAALARLEEEVSGPYDEPEHKTVTYHVVVDALGVDVTVAGPVSDMNRLEDSVARLLAKMRDKRTE